MVLHLFDAKPLAEPLLIDHYFDRQKHIPVKFDSK